MIFARVVWSYIYLLTPLMDGYSIDSFKSLFTIGRPQSRNTHRISSSHRSKLQLECSEARLIDFRGRGEAEWLQPLETPLACDGLLWVFCEGQVLLFIAFSENNHFRKIFILFQTLYVRKGYTRTHDFGPKHLVFIEADGPDRFWSSRACL